MTARSVFKSIDFVSSCFHHEKPTVVVCVPQETLQRSVSVEEQRPASSRAPSKTTLNELLDTLKLLEEEPERLSEPKSYQKEKYAWIDEVSVGAPEPPLASRSTKQLITCNHLSHRTETPTL